MKTRILKQTLVIAIVMITIASCSKDFLEVTPTGTYMEDNYYKNESQAFSGLIAAYDIMGKYAGGFDNLLVMLNSGSDDFYAGGGSATDGTGLQAFSNYTLNPTNMPRSLWSDHYLGISRANVLLQRLPEVSMDENLKARFAAEAKALRAYYYFQLVTLFGDVPFYTTNIAQPDFYKVQKSPESVVYTQIEKDLTEAILNLPPTVVKETEGARFTKGAAQALLGKVYLFEKKNTQAATLLAEVNGATPGQTNQYGNKLLDNFASLWVIDNKFNSESILEVSYTEKSNATWDNWGTGAAEGNIVNQMISPRGYSASKPTAPAYYSGWAFNPVTIALADAMKDDPRFGVTLINMNALVASGDATYSPAFQNSGYFLKKFIPTNADRSTGGGPTELNFRQNMYVIRLADSYLMEAEALGGTGARAQSLLDAVRKRVGLAPVPVSIQAIWNERRMELAGEGQRWLDLVRTGRAPAVLANRGFQANKHEHWPIPIQETENTMVTQNPAYQ